MWSEYHHLRSGSALLGPRSPPPPSSLVSQAGSFPGLRSHIPGVQASALFIIYEGPDRGPPPSDTGD